MKYNFKKEIDTAILPTKHTKESAGIDFYAAEEVYIPIGESRIVSTGISWKPDFISKIFTFKFTVSLVIQSRSGLAFKEGIEASNAGVIDADYVSTDKRKAIIHVKLYNHGTKNKLIKIGDKICQGVPQIIPMCGDVPILDNNRNGMGFGSSDEKEIK